MNRVEAYKREIRNAQIAAELRNVEMDALHYVWCSGGCEGGVHRHTKEALTPEVVAAAIQNTTRLYQWFVGNAGKVVLLGHQEKEWERAKASIGEAALDQMRERAEMAEARLANLQEALRALAAREIPERANCPCAKEDPTDAS